MTDEQVVEQGEVEKPTSPPVKLRYTIETPNGVYKLRRPVGRVGVTHFTIVTKAIPSSVDPETGDPVVSPADQERFENAFVEWTQKVLPAIFIEGPFKVDEMPGEDQYALFLAMFTTMKFGGQDLFRFID